MSWPKFMDMHSGGGTKTDYEYIYIEADEESATNVFGHLFDEHPHSVACQCCGNNFSVTSSETLEEATEYERSRYKKSLEEYLKDPSIKVIYASDINPEHLKDNPVDYYEADHDWGYDEEENEE